MKIGIFFILFLALISCQGEFKDKSQAKNEVNKQGFRDGRWVEYWDSTGTVLADTLKGYQYYSLSEYENGSLIGKFNIFYRNGGLSAQNETYLDSNKLIEKIRKPRDLRIRKQTVYSDSGNLFRIRDFNPIGKGIYDLVYNEKGGIVYKSYNTYFKNGLIKTVIDSVFGRFDDKLNRQDDYMYSLKEMNKIDTVRYETEYLESSNYDNINSSTRKFIINEFREVDHIPIKSRILSEDNLQDLPFRLNYLVLSNKNFKDTIHIKKTINLIVNSKKSSSSGQLKSCVYCGRSFNILSGYVQGLQQSCAIKYSLAIGNMKLAQEAGYPIASLNRLKADYARGRFYCSVRCVQYSGISFCAV